jgi:hypothetical protein
MKFFGFFAGLGTRVLNLFDADHYQTQISTPSIVPSPSENPLENGQQIPTITQTLEPSSQVGNPSEIDLSQYEINSAVEQPTPPENK